MPELDSSYISPYLLLFIISCTISQQGWSQKHNLLLKIKNNSLSYLEEFLETIPSLNQETTPSEVNSTTHCHKFPAQAKELRFIFLISITTNVWFFSDSLGPSRESRRRTQEWRSLSISILFFQITSSNLLPSKPFPLSTKVFTGPILAPKPFSYGALVKVLDSPALGIRLYMAVLAQNRENMM